MKYATMEENKGEVSRLRFLDYGISGPVMLAPMAGVTDWAFRSVCARLGAAVTVTEMVSSRALVYQDRKSRALLRKNPGSLCGAQIFGNDPQIMAQAAALAAEYSGCDFIDINMGCPMPKIVNNGDGAALLREPELAGRIVRAVSAAVRLPVTVKTRLGWDRGSLCAVEFARRMEDSGAAAVTIHGRTRAMQYAGRADWDEIGKVVQAVRIPVIANGDLFSAEDALRCRAHCGAALYMVGRGSFGDPWLPGRIAAALEGREIPALPPLSERMTTAHEQFLLALEDKGEHIACLEARKHLAWYLRGVAYGGYWKEQISRVSTAEEVERVIAGIVRELR